MWSTRVGRTAFGTLALAGALLAAGPGAGGDLFEMVAQVNGHVILLEDVEERLAVLEEVAGGDAAGLRARILPLMVDELLLIDRAAELGLDEEKVYRAARREFMEKSGIDAEEDLGPFLRKSGMDLEEFRRILLRNYVPMLVVEKEVRSLPGDFQTNRDAYLRRLRAEAHVWVHPDYSGIQEGPEG